MATVMQGHQAAISKFHEKSTNAKMEGDNVQYMKVMMEQREYMSKNNVKASRQYLVMLASGAVFTTQFFAVKKMADANFPGFATGGTMWFHDLTAPDPLILPMISALTMLAVYRSGIETGGATAALGPRTQLGIQVVIPVGIMTMNYFWEFPQAVLLYWVTSNVISLAFAGIYSIPSVKRFLGIPVLKKSSKTGPVSKKGGLMEQITTRRPSVPTLDDLRRKDAEQFKKAGTQKPAIKVR
ncbi:60Kd inner membrane protein [Aphelenchoides avenae]|nr:60Kd inner membrane protein [Aphelenchus avenae]